MVKTSFYVAAIVAAAAGFYVSSLLRYDFVTLDGEKHQWQDYQGKVLIVNYFAEWCAPCLKEVPELNSVARYLDDNGSAALFAVNFDNLQDERLVNIKQKYDMQFSMVSGLPTNAPFSMPKSLPATYIIGQDGELLKLLQGEQTADKLIDIIEALTTTP